MIALSMALIQSQITAMGDVKNNLHTIKVLFCLFQAHSPLEELFSIDSAQADTAQIIQVIFFKFTFTVNNVKASYTILNQNVDTTRSKTEVSESLASHITMFPIIFTLILFPIIFIIVLYSPLIST